VDDAPAADPGVEQVVGFQIPPSLLEHLDGEFTDDLPTDHPLSGLDVAAAVPLRARLTPSAGPVAVESALTVPPAGLVFSRRGMFGLTLTRDVAGVAVVKGGSERLETTLGSVGVGVRHETEG